MGLCERWQQAVTGKRLRTGRPNFCVDVEGCIKERQAESLGLGLEHIQPFSIVITNVSKTVFAQKWVLRIPPCALFQRKNMA
jgi:hypothetical protein